MSRIPVWCEIVCRTCALQSDGAFSSRAIPKRALVKAARSSGWQFKHDEAFCGSRCLAKFEEERTPKTSVSPK